MKDEHMEWEMEAPTLAGLQKDAAGFTVPPNYFEVLNAQIKSQIAIEKFKSVGFTTPSNYFNKLQTSILDQTVNAKQTTTVIRFWSSDLMKYAAAACFILLTASALYLNQQSAIKETRSTELANETMLYDIDESVIIEHLKESQTATNKGASQTEMESYILDHYSSNDLSNNL